MKLKKGDIIKIKVRSQGKPLVSTATIRKIYKDVAIVDVHMKSKYCDAVAFISGDNEAPGMTIQSNEFSLYLSKRKQDWTIIQFPDFINWSIISAFSGKYTITISLIK